MSSTERKVVARGRGRGARGRATVIQKPAATVKRGRRPSSGSSTSTQSHQSHGFIGVSYENIPASACMPACMTTDPGEVLWVNNKGDTLPQRQVIGEKVYVRQQPAAPPPTPQILLLSDQMMAAFQENDRYIDPAIKSGYAVVNFTQDIQDGMINLDYPYVAVFLGTMQLASFEPNQFQAQVMGLLHSITQQSQNSHIVLCGLAPRPCDYARSKIRVRNINKTLELAAQEATNYKGWNVSFLSVEDNFLDANEDILDPHINFVDKLFFSTSGFRQFRAALLRYLGFFPKKA